MVATVGTALFCVVSIFPCLQSSDTIPAERYIDTAFQAIGPNLYALGNVTVNSQTGEIRIPGRVNMSRGLIEYLATTPYGKTHEAVLTLNTRPMHLQLALLLLGIEPGGNIAFQGDTTIPVGDLVSIHVEWLRGSDTVRHLASDLVSDYTGGMTMSETDWVFTGSIVVQDGIAADVSGSLIATYSDPEAILNNPLEGRVDDEVYGANEEVLPDPDTPVLMIITASKKDLADEK